MMTENKGFAVNALRYRRVTFVSSEAYRVKSAVVAACRMICAGNYRTFNAVIRLLFHRNTPKKVF